MGTVITDFLIRQLATEIYEEALIFWAITVNHEFRVGLNFKLSDIHQGPGFKIECVPPTENAATVILSFPPPSLFSYTKIDPVGREGKHRKEFNGMNTQEIAAYWFAKRLLEEAYAGE